LLQNGPVHVDVISFDLSIDKASSAYE